MDFTELQTFVAVVEERSFSRAAIRLYRTQPAVSQAIRRLEEQVGERLFTRASRQPELTEAGVLLLEYAGRLCALREEARAALAQLRGLREGDVLIGASDALFPAILPLVDAFRHACPRARVDVRRVRGRDVTAAVLSRELDFGLTTTQPADPAIEAIPFGEDDLVLVVPPSHPLASRAAVRLRELAWETLVGEGEHSWSRERVEQLFARHRARPRIGTVLPDVEAIKRAVGRGLGIAVLPRCSTTDDVARGALKTVPIAERGVSRQLWLACLAEGPRTPSAAAFLELVRHPVDDGVTSPVRIGATAARA